ncbi:MAG: CHAT domain-containing protein [Povalibacter sp.]
MRSYAPGWVIGLLAYALTLAMPASAATCPEEHSRRPLLGEYVPTSAVETLLTIQQQDLDVEVVVRQGNQLVVYDSPGGRNGIEWVLLARGSSAQVCFYVVFGQKAADAYQLTMTDVARLDEASLQSASKLSQAGALWASQSEAARSTAIALYESVAGSTSSPRVFREYARLYAAAAQMQRYLYDAAIQSLEKLNHGSVESNAVRYNAHWLDGAIANRRNELPTSIQALETALKLARQAQLQMKRPLRRDLAEITNLLGEAYLSAGNIARGTALVEQARSQSGDDHQLLGMVHNNLGFVDLLRADRASLTERSKHLSLSLENHFKARDHAVRAGDLQELALIENNIASLFERVGDLRKAREHYEEALRLIGNSDDPLRLQLLYRNLGHIDQYLGDYEKAERFTTAAVRISESVAPNEAVRLHCRLGTIYRLRDHLQEAVAEHSICESQARATQLVRDEIEALYELSVDRYEQHDPNNAMIPIVRASSLLSEVQDRDLESKVHAQHALLAQQQGMHEEARRLADLSINAAEAARYPTARVDALATAMNISIQQGRSDAAMQYGLRALNEIEALHAHLDAERLGPAWSGRTREIYDKLSLLEIDRYRTSRSSDDLQRALQIIERGRAISLRQQFSTQPGVRAQLAASPLLATLSAIANDHAKSPKSADGDSLPLAYYHAHDLLTRSRLAGVDDVPVPTPLSATQIQQSLSDTETALYYSLTSQRAFLFVIRRDTLEFRELSDRSSIDAAIANVRSALLSGPGAAIEPLKALSRLILPSSVLTGSGTLIFVPDGTLHVVPFAALHAGTPTMAYAPVMQRFAIKVIPSLSAYFMPKSQGSRPHDIELAVFANPTFDASAGKTPVRDAQALPSTQREAEKLAALFPPDRTRVFTRASASRANLLSPTARYARVLHIASHGHFDSASPDNVGFALSTQRSRGEFDSGFVTLSELFTQPFDNDLVVISGCDTAMGLQREGEGMMSVARAFMAQGAPHVISTLWAVSDQASAEFMPLFYSHLTASHSIAESLQYAQQQLRMQKAYADPFFWAPYVFTTVEPSDSLRFEPVVVPKAK